MTYIKVAERIRNFLGSGWTYLRFESGPAYWIHTKTETVVPSSRNYL